jgi:hypothetical protein
MNLFLRPFAIHSILLKHVHGGTHVNVQGLDHLQREEAGTAGESGRGRGFVSFTFRVRSGRRKRPSGENPGGSRMREEKG